MVNLLIKLLSLAERLFDWLEGRKKLRQSAEIREAAVNHDAEAMNRIIQKMRDEKR